MDNSQRSEDPRATLVNQLTYLHNLLRYINSQWQAKAQVAQRYEALVPPKARWGVRPLLLWTAGITFALFTVATPIRFLSYNLAALLLSDDWANSHRGFVLLLQIAIPIAISFGFALLVVQARNKYVLPRQNTRIERANQQREEHNATVWTEEQQVNAQLTQAGRDFTQHIGDWFPQKYLYEEAVAFCAEMVRDHRASSVQEAIQCYVTELERRELLDMHAAQLDAQERTRKTAAVGNIVSAAMTGAAIGTVRAEAKQTRSANAAHAARITEQAKQPKTVYVKKGWSIW